MTGTPIRRLWLMWPVRVIQARPRLFISWGLGVVVGLALPHSLRPVTRVLLGWNAGILIYFAAVAALVFSSHPHTLMRRAGPQDDGRFSILFLTIIAAAAAFGAIFFQVLFVKDVHGLQRALHLALAGLTVASAWTFIHAMFGLHYAGEYYAPHGTKAAPTGERRGGLRFPGEESPDYFDFFYFSFVIGVACATADVDITSRAIRRTALVHSVLAFFFNSAVLALAINIVAGLA